MIDATIQPVSSGVGTSSPMTPKIGEAQRDEGALSQFGDSQTIDLFAYVNLEQSDFVSAELRAFADKLANPSTMGEHVLAGLENMRLAFAEMHDEALAYFRPESAGPAEVARPGEQASMAAGPASQSIEASQASNGDHVVVDRSSEVSGREDADFAQRFDSLEQHWRETFRMQYDMSRVMAHEALASKVAGKSSRNLDTLLRGQ